MTFAIITITKNDPGLSRTLESIARQSIKPNQLIVVNGGDPVSAISSLADHVLVINEADSGIYDAMNKGVKACETDHMLFLNAGDELYDRHSIELLLPHLKTNRITSFAIVVTDDCGNRWRLPPSAPKHQGMIFPSSNILYDASLRVYADGYYIQAMRAKYCEVQVNITPVLFYLGGVSSTPSIRLCRIAWRECGILEALKKFVIFALAALIGAQAARALIYRLKGYERIYN